MPAPLLQELGLSGFSSERADTQRLASKEGEQWRTLFATFYKLVFEHIASLVEVSTLVQQRLGSVGLDAGLCMQLRSKQKVCSIANINCTPDQAQGCAGGC